jgi:predicted AAA+ superfamily ATPase
MFSRLLNPPESQSFFLFGARGTGKSTLLSTRIPADRALWLDLLDLDLEAELSVRPMALLERLEPVRATPGVEWVVIDEVQKVPALLDVVQLEMGRRRFRFALSGSSARKLKRGAANLLAGRALEHHLFPLTHLELADRFDLDFALRWGSMPAIFSMESESERQDYLRTYANTYVKEEIQAEQLVRKLAPFRAFLDIAADASGQIVNYSKIARAVGSDAVSVKSYFSILEDTLLGFHLPAFDRSVRSRQRQAPKFYFFDLGVQAALRRHLHLPLAESTYEYGRRFEQFVITEIFRLNHYRKADYALSYLRTKDDAEIDLIVERPGAPTFLIEIKSHRRVSEDDVRSVAAFAADLPQSVPLCLSRDEVSRTIRGVKCLPWHKGFAELGLG